MFSATHLLVSRSQQTPVHLIPSPSGFFLVTENEWQQETPPAFSLHSKRGFFCHGIPVIGYSLEPVNTQYNKAESIPTAICS